MFGKVTIDGREVAMRGSAATPYRYKDVFEEDMIKRSQELTDTDSLDFAQKVGFIMAMQAAGEDFGKLNREQFVQWCDQFTSDGMMEAAGEILLIYAGNARTASEAKKN